MIKKIISFIIVLALAFSLVGCKDEKNVITHWEYCGEIDGNYLPLYVYYDKNTKVMYAVNNNKGLATVLYNADGTPMLYEGDLE